MTIQYHDDPTVLDDEDLWRRIPTRWIVPDLDAGGLRISSAAFDDHPNGTPMSVLLSSVVRADGRAPESLLGPGFHMSAFTAGVARSNGQGIRRAPLPEEPAHAEVFGKKTKAVKRRLAESARWVVAPSD